MAPAHRCCRRRPSRAAAALLFLLLSPAPASSLAQPLPCARPFSVHALHPAPLLPAVPPLSLERLLPPRNGGGATTAVRAAGPNVDSGFDSGDEGGDGALDHRKAKPEGDVNGVAEDGGDGGERFASPFSPVRRIEKTMREVYKLRDYRFGDFTRGAASKAKRDFEKGMRQATGNEGYRFGDLTKWELSKVSRDTDVNETVKMANSFWREALTPNQRRDVWVIGLYFLSIALLAYNSLSNCHSGLAFAVAWTVASRDAGASPLAPGLWPAFIQKHATLSLWFNAALLCPLRVALFVPWFFQYNRLVRGTERRSPLRERFPILNRILALFTAWAIANVAAVLFMTVAAMWAGSLWTGVTVLPALPVS